MGHSEIYRQPWIKDKYKKIKWEGKLSASADGKTTSRFQRIAWLRRAPGKAMESIFSMGKYWDKTIASWTTFCRYDNVKINRMRCTDETNKCWLWPWRFNSQPKWLKNYTKKFFSFIWFRLLFQSARVIKLQRSHSNSLRYVFWPLFCVISRS